MVKCKQFKRILSFAMAIITLLTMLPSSVLMALAATSSGQVDINNGSKYAVQWEYLYTAKGNKIYQYNRNFANNDTNYTAPYYDILKKYVTTGNAGGQKEPTSVVVPIYRVSRSNGDTDDDVSAKAVTTVNIENANNLYNSATQDEINITRSQANMIVKVLLNGLKQFTGSQGTTQYYKEQLYFLATQVIIWEIQEGKRVGWTNSADSYTNTQSSSYPSNSRSMIRSTSLSQAYDYPSGDEKENKYYWHDYYYTVYNNQFSGYTDYYNEILEACANLDAKFQYGTGSTPNLYFEKNINTSYNMEYKNLSNKYELSFVVDSSFVGESYGKYDVNDIVLPIDEVITKPNGSKVIYSLPNNSSLKLSNGFSSSIGINGITADGYYYYVRFSNTKYGFIKTSDVANKYTSNVSVSQSSNLLGHCKLTFETSTATTKTLKVIWPKNVPNAFNEATYFSGAGEAVRGYISGGNQTEENVYFNLKTPCSTVSFKCGVCGKVFGTWNVPTGYTISLSDLGKIPEHNENSDFYTFSHWSKGGTQVNSLWGQKISADTTFVKNYTENQKTINFWCTIPESGSDDYVLIKSITGSIDTKVTVPNIHNHSDYQFAYWSTSPSGSNANLESGNSYTINDLATDYYAVYDDIYTVEYRCGLCNELIGSFNGISGTTYTVPFEEHQHTGNYVDKNTGQEYSYDDLDFSFSKWSEGSSPGKTATITESKVIYSQYSFKNTVTVQSHLYNSDTASAEELESWNNSIKSVNYTTNSGQSSEYLDDEYNTVVFTTNTNDFSYVNANAPKGWHIVKYDVIDINGEVSNYTNGGNYAKINSAISETQGSIIKVYYEPDTVQKTITINYVSAGQECDFRNEDNALILSRSVTVDYNELLDITNREFTDSESGISLKAFEGYLDNNGMMYMYAGEYGYIQDDNIYNHCTGDKVGLAGTLPELKDYRVTSNVSVYIYYELPEEGGISFSLYATTQAGESSYNLLDNNSSLKMYSSDSYLELSSVYVTDNEGNVTVNSLLTLEDDLTEKLASQKSNNDGSVTGYPTEMYPFVSTIELAPEDLQMGKFYYFVYDDWAYDKFYYSPTVIGGIVWTGNQLEYNTICDVGPILQTLQILTQDKDGNVSPAENATVFWQNESDYTSTWSKNSLQIIWLATQLGFNQITQEKFDEEFDKLMNTVQWTCQCCDKLNTTILDGIDLSLTCNYCGGNNDGLNVDIGIVKTNTQGICTFYLNEDDEYVFNVMSEDFINGGETDNPINYSEKTTEIYKYNVDGTKGEFVSSSDNYSSENDLLRADNLLDTYGLWTLYSQDGKDEIEDENGNKIEIAGKNGRGSITGSSGYTVCTMYQVLKPLTFEITETDDENTFVDLSQGDYQFNLDVYQDGKIVDKKQVLASDCIVAEDETYSFNYTPEEFGTYRFYLSVVDNNDISNKIYVTPSSISYDYTGRNDTLKYIVSTINTTKDLCFSMVFDSELMTNTVTGSSSILEEYNPAPSDYQAGEYAKYAIETFNLQSFDVFYNPVAFSGDVTEETFLEYKLDTIPVSSINNALQATPTELIFPKTNSWRGDAIVNLYQSSYTGDSGINYTIEVYEIASSSYWQQTEIGDNSSKLSDYLRTNSSDLYPQHSLSLNAEKSVVNKVAILIKANDIPDGYYFLNPIYEDTYIYRGEIEEQQGIYTSEASYLTDDCIDYATISKKFSMSDFYDNVLDWLGINRESNDFYFTSNSGRVYYWKTGGALINNPYYSDSNESWIYPKSDLEDSWEVVPIVFTQTKTAELPQMDVDFVEPNSDYNFGTDVISTFKVTNGTGTDYTDLVPLKTEFTAKIEYNINGEEKNIEITSQSKEMVVPANKQNIVYYTWSVPTRNEILNEIISLTGAEETEIEIMGAKVVTSVDNGSGLAVEGIGTVNVSEFCNSIVEKEGMDLDGGDSYIYKSPQADKNYANVASWQEYICDNGVFELTENSARLGYESNLLRPHEDNPTKEVRENQWVTKSGYALSTYVTTNANFNSTGDKISSNAIVEAQSALVFYPEYNFSTNEDKYEALIYDETQNSFIFRELENAATTKSRHYIPIWYPDIEYQTQTLVSNMWTPAGMLSYLGVSNSVLIEGSLFDNYNSKQMS